MVGPPSSRSRDQVVTMAGLDWRSSKDPRCSVIDGALFVFAAPRRTSASAPNKPISRAT